MAVVLGRKGGSSSSTPGPPNGPAGGILDGTYPNPDLNVNGLTAVTTVATTDEYVVERGGVTQKITGADLLTANKSREQLRVEAQGLLAESFSRGNIGSQTLLTTQKLEGALVGLRAGDTVTGVAVAVQANSASLTVARVALYSTAGVLLASSTNSAAIWDAGAGTVVSRAFTTPYTVTTAGGYYACLLAVGTTPPTIYRGSNLGVMEGIGAGFPAFVLQTGQANLPSPATLTEETVCWWMGVY